MYHTLILITFSNPKRKHICSFSGDGIHFIVTFIHYMKFAY